MDKPYLCESCFEDVEELYQCSDCDHKMCFNCIGYDDFCPECHSHDKIFPYDPC